MSLIIINLNWGYHKDLYDFTIDELRDVLKSLQAKSIRNLQDKNQRLNAT
ncbi:MAG: hypothetical protein ACQEXB_27980 [Bacillota bacterium]